MAAPQRTRQSFSLLPSDCVGSIRVVDTFSLHLLCWQPCNVSRRTLISSVMSAGEQASGISLAGASCVVVLPASNLISGNCDNTPSGFTRPVNHQRSTNQRNDIAEPLNKLKGVQIRIPRHIVVFLEKPFYFARPTKMPAIGKISITSYSAKHPLGFFIPSPRLLI